MKEFSSRDIKNALAHRHEEDIYVEELGHVIGKYVRIDSWAMSRGTNLITGYEVKVDRKDFLNDGKWHLYKKMCNEFYFVCPWGMIQPQELEEGIGLIWMSKTGGRLMTKKHSVRHDIDKEIEYSLVKSILWNRCTISRGRRLPEEDKLEYWKQWLEEKKIDRTLGRHLGKTLKRTIEKRILEVEKRNQELEYQIKMLEDFKSELCSLTQMDKNHDIGTLIFQAKKMIKTSGDDKLSKVRELSLQIVNIINK